MFSADPLEKVRVKRRLAKCVRSASVNVELKKKKKICDELKERIVLSFSSSYVAMA